MSTFKLPNSNKQFIQSNQGDYQGNVWSTFNIDLASSPGVVKVSPKLEKAVGAVTWGSDDIVQALAIYDSRYYIATSQDIFSCAVSDDPRVEANWGAIDFIGSIDVGLETDAVVFENLLLVSLGTNVASWNGTTLDVDWWTTVSKGGEVGNALTVLKPHTMDVLRSSKDVLFITDGNKVVYAELDAGHTDITLDEGLTANCLTPSLDLMWAGTFNETDSNAFVFSIRNGSDVPAAAYQVDGRACLTMFTYKNVPYVITERGYVQGFNGAGFETVARFPWAEQSKTMTGARPGVVQDSPTSMAIHPKGAKVVGDKVYMYVDTDNEFASGTNLDSRAPSGIWVLDLLTYSLSHHSSLSLAETDYGWSKVTRSGPVLITNTPQTRIMVGGEVNNTKGVWMETANTPRGYFVTARHEADSVMDTFNSLYTKVDTLPSGSSVTVKYRTTWNEPVLVDDITWLNATQFTTTSSDVTDALIGQEIEIIAGYRSGYLANITAVEGGTTKTVTIDQSIGLLNETSDIQIDNWLTLGTHSPEEGEVKELGAKAPGTFVQYKVILTGNVTLREVLSSSENKNSVK